MKITKYVHSCLLIEEENYVAIIDPGKFSWDSGLFSVDSLSRLDDIIVTHEHFDHMHLPFIAALRSKFPEARITSTASVAHALQEAGIDNTLTTSHDVVELFDAPHESLAPLGEAPQHTAVHLLGELTHLGDNHHAIETKSVLALPVQAPWGSMVNAAALGLSLRPKTIIPIHDWHWNDAHRVSAYEQLSIFFASHDIAFISPKDGVAFEV